MQRELAAAVMDKCENDAQPQFSGLRTPVPLKYL